MATAVQLPPPRAVFYDANGAPLAGGFVHTYVPGGTTPKTSWQDAAQATPNANPITLDSAGSCLLYGSGEYQLTVTDSLGNSIPGYSGVTYQPLVQISTTPTTKATSYTILTTDQGAVFEVTAAAALTLPSSVSAGGGWSCDVANFSTIASPVSVTVLRAGSDTIDADSATTVYVLPGERVSFLADGLGGWLTKGRTIKGRVINVASFSDAGSSTTSLTLSNLNAAAFSYQPVSTASKLNIKMNFQGVQNSVSSTNVVATYQIYETTSSPTGLGNQYTLENLSSAGGNAMNAAQTITFLGVSNSVLTARKFNLYGATSNASGAAGGTSIYCEISEIQNA